MFGRDVWMIDIGILLIAIAFVALVIFVIIALLAITKSIKHANKALGEIEKDIEDLSHESVKLIQHTNTVLGALDPYCHIAKRMGQKVESYIAPTQDEESPPPSSKKEEVSQTIIEVAEWALIGVTLFERFRTRRKR